MGGETRRVLWLESDAACERRINGLLRQAGRVVELHRTSSLQECLAEFSRFSPSALLVDLEPPDASGAEIVEALRTRTQTTPIVVFTAADDDDMALRCIRAGAQDYLVKDETGGHQLWRALQVAIERSRLEEPDLHDGPDGILQFEDFEIDIDARELRHQGRSKHLNPTPFDLLLCLVLNRERLVSKDELLDQVWPDAMVSDTALSSALKEVRRAIGDDGEHQRSIKTVRGRGYRFVAPVTEISREHAGDRPHDEAEVHRAPDTGAPKRGGPLAHVLRAVDLLHVSKTALSPGDALTDHQNLVIKGEYHLGHYRYREAVEAFEKAIALAPDSAFTSAGLAVACVMAGSLDDVPNRDRLRQRAREAAEHAALLDPNLGRAYHALGQINSWDWKWSAAERALRRAQELEPRYPWNAIELGILHAVCGRSAEALEQLRFAIACAPLDVLARSVAAGWMRVAGDAAGSAEELARVLEIDPRQPHAQRLAAWAHLDLDNAHEASEALATGYDLELDPLLAAIETGGTRGVIAALMSGPDSARLTHLERAACWSRLHEIDRAFEEIDAAFELRQRTLPTVAADPAFHALHSDVRFAERIDQLGVRRNADRT